MPFTQMESSSNRNTVILQYILHIYFKEKKRKQIQNLISQQLNVTEFVYVQRL